MQSHLGQYSLKVTPLFDHIKKQAQQSGVYLYYNNSKETLQLFKSEESFNCGDKYIGAIQYEGSNDYAKREPHLVSFRFKRANLPHELKQALEGITSFRRDKNSGASVNLDAESIAFKFQSLAEEGVEKTIAEIVDVLRKHV